MHQIISMVLHSCYIDSIVPLWYEDYQISDCRKQSDTPAVGRYVLLKPSVCDGGPPVLLCRPAEWTVNMVITVLDNQNPSFPTNILI